jgi:SLT domain-containing protein
MSKRTPTTVNARNWTAQEMSVHAEQLYYLLQTISENFLKWKMPSVSH